MRFVSANRRVQSHLSRSRYVGISSTMTTTKTYHQPALTSVAHPPRSRANEGSKTKRERDTSVHGCPRGVPPLPVFPPFFSSVSRLAFRALPFRFPPPVAPSLYLSRLFSLSPTLPFFSRLSLFLLLTLCIPAGGPSFPSALRAR